jgi:multidrug resistance efflux pump
LVGLLAVCVGSAGLWAWGRSSADRPAARPADQEAAATTVDVIHPTKGGIERTTVQPGSVHSFESVDLFAMISGYMKTQSVDIGSRVEKGQVLAEIAIPREEKIAMEAGASLEQAKARAAQMDAEVKAAEADRDTAEAMIVQAESDVKRLSALRTLAESKFGRMQGLYDLHAVEKKVLEEQMRDRDAAIAAEKTGILAVLTARSRKEGMVAKLDQARADVVEARAAIEVAEARVAAAQVDLEYGKIIAPFDGVVTLRSFHPGEFIRSAVTGAAQSRC